MRLWTLDPKYLDSKGLVALWREALLAKKVLQNKTKGYKQHPQLERFRNTKDPIAAISWYLLEVWKEAERRNFKFDKRKIGLYTSRIKIKSTQGQLKYEFDHLKKKLFKRSKIYYKQLKLISIFEAHPSFQIVSGEIEKWEKIS